MGDSRFAVACRLPYRGEKVIEPRVLYPLQQYMVVALKSMKFEPQTPGVFRPAPGRADANTLVTGPVEPGQPPAFRLSGIGSAAQTRSQPAVAKEGGSTVPAPPPEVKTAPRGRRDDYAWFLADGLGLAPAAAGFFAHRRKRLQRPSVGHNLV